jgi:endonuclease/exonuclease/phosphatase family metal-dependent hydrolase
MRIVSYNILDGGEGRADPLAEVIEAQRPDVVALVEAGVAPVVERIAARLQMDFIIAESDGGAAALLSRYPIAESINHALLHPEVITGSFLEAVLRPPGGELSIGVVHLHPYAFEGDENVRMRELRVVLDGFADRRARGQAHLLAGDFNASSPTQQVDIGKCRRSTRQAFIANGGRLPRRAIGSILDAGYIDAVRQAVGASADTLGTFSTQRPGERVDFVFIHGIQPARITCGHIEQDRLAKYASDHFPVCIEIQ